MTNKSSYKCKKLSPGHYNYRGYTINCLGYYHPEHRICWECIDSDGSAFGHSYTKRDCMSEIDYEIEKQTTEKYKTQHYE